LLANDTETRENWITGLEMLIKGVQKSSSQSITDKYVNDNVELLFYEGK
jgi:hypothetical protein